MKRELDLKKNIRLDQIKKEEKQQILEKRKRGKKTTKITHSLISSPLLLCHQLQCTHFSPDLFFSPIVHQFHFLFFYFFLNPSTQSPSPLHQRHLRFMQQFHCRSAFFSTLSTKPQPQQQSTSTTRHSLYQIPPLLSERRNLIHLMSWAFSLVAMSKPAINRTVMEEKKKEE